MKERKVLKDTTKVKEYMRESDMSRQQHEEELLFRYNNRTDMSAEKTICAGCKQKTKKSQREQQRRGNTGLGLDPSRWVAVQETAACKFALGTEERPV